MINAAEKAKKFSSKKEITYLIWSTDNRSKKFTKKLFLNKKLTPTSSLNDASFELNFIFLLGNLKEINMKSYKTGEYITVNGKVLEHFLNLPKDDEQFEKRKKEILSGSGISIKKRFMVDCIEYLD